VSVDYERVIRQALAVPSIIQPQNRSVASAHRLRQRAALPNAEGAVDLCDRVIAATIETLEAGELDSMFGGWTELTHAVFTVMQRMPEGLPERETRHTTEMLLTAINHWADTHDEEIGD
jgi:hypothetical protein